MTIDFDLDFADGKSQHLSRKLSHSRAIYPSALVEDIANSALPVPGGSSRSNYRIWLDPPSEVHEKLVAQALSTRHYRGREIDDAAYDFFHAAVASLIAFQEAAYEIVGLQRSDNPTAGVRLVSVPPGSLEGTSERLVQRIPESVALSMGLPKELPLDPNTILIFRPPASIRDELPHMIEALAELSDLSALDFALPRLTGNARRVPVDWEQFSQTKDIALAKATRSIGWTPGSFELREGKSTEHYFWHRQLALERFKAELRDDTLSTLNDGLRRIGKLVGSEFALRIDGLPTLEEIEIARSHLFAGDLSLTEIHDSFRIY